MYVTLKSRLNTHDAKGEYDGTGIVVLEGSKINLEESFPKMSDEIRQYRHNPEYVDSNGMVLKQIRFSSPTAAAIFVTGRSSNGKVAWRINGEISIKNFLQNKEEKI